MATQHPNVAAFLLMIRKCEGTATPNGYRYLFGSLPGREKLFNSFEAHPQVFFSYTDKAGKKLKTSAAGAYQITYTTWIKLKAQLALKDFSPESQDTAAVRLIKDAGALEDVIAGRFATALTKVRKIWASLPGSGNNQPEKSFAQATKWFTQAGGVISSLLV